MNRLHPLGRLALLSALAVTIGLAGCSEPSDTPPLAGAALGGPFTLTDQDGRQVTDKDFAGKYKLIYFGFTYCPDVCPVDLQTISQAMRKFEQSDPAAAARVQPIFISVDPARDTPEVMKRYVSAFHPRLVGLTGSEQQISEVSQRYGVYYQKAQPPGSSDYLVNHSRVTLLFGPEGNPIAILPHDQGADAMVAELERWTA